MLTFSNRFRLLKAAYGVDKSEANAIKHLSYLEAWSANDPYYNKDTKGAITAD
ncbi:MAG: glycoside hydrolase family 70 protein [Streptococcus salivarius]